MEHPAKFSDRILAVIDAHLPEGSIVLDPFAGVGRIHELFPRVRTIGVEIEAEWAAQHYRTIHGDSTRLPFSDGYFDAVATSPTYGNRMADKHNARDSSKRHTYRHVLGRELDPNNSGGMQWGDCYRELHAAVYAECKRVLRPGGRLIVNTKDHCRKGRTVRVTAWHVTTLLDLGFDLLAVERVRARGNRFGANGDRRSGYETVAVFTKGEDA